MKLNTLIIAAAFATAPAVTFAQDWTGPYAGFQIGTAEIDEDVLLGEVDEFEG